MNIQASAEAKRIWINLAKAMADALECPETTAMLADGLSECVNEISALLASDRSRSVNIAILRGLASGASQKLARGSSRGVTRRRVTADVESQESS